MHVYIFNKIDEFCHVHPDLNHLENIQKSFDEEGEICLLLLSRLTLDENCWFDTKNITGIKKVKTDHLSGMLCLTVPDIPLKIRDESRQIIIGNPIFFSLKKLKFRLCFPL